MAEDTSALPVQKPKRLPFKPTALRKAPSASIPTSTAVEEGKPGEGNDGLDLFRRANEMKSTLAADREREARRKQKRIIEEDKRRKEIADQTEPVDEQEITDLPSPSQQLMVDEENTHSDDPFMRDLVTPPPKRSKLTASASSKRSARHLDLDDDDDDSHSTNRQLNFQDETSTLPTPSASRTSFVPPSSDAILIDSDESEADEDLDIQITGTQPKTQENQDINVVEREPTPDFNSAADEDPDFEKYVRQAELAQEEASKSKESRLMSDSAVFSDPLTGSKETVEIVLTSTLPGTKVFGAKFLFTKPLRVVRDSWVALQRKNGIPLPDEQNDHFILTWRRKRVYMVSTLHSLGIRPLGDGRVGIEGTSSTEGLNKQGTRVHMEVWTPELFAEMEHEEDLRRRRAAGEFADEAETQGAGAVEEEEEIVKLHIILQSRELKPMKLMVRPETVMADLVLAFRKSNNIADETEISLWFDGEKLDDDTTIEDADIDDMDTLEVHLK